MESSPTPLEPPALKRIVGALILGSDHPLSVREIRKVLEGVEADSAPETDTPISDESLLEPSTSPPEEPFLLEGQAPPPEPPEDEQTKARHTALDASIREAIQSLQSDLSSLNLGLTLVEVAEGFRFQTDAECGPWVRKLLNRGRPQRISRPVIETLAIIAYRQPISRSEIESIRGVGVGHVLKALTEMRLIRIVGKSDLPGHPFLFGTTPAFLDHFGLKNLNDLNRLSPGVERTPPAEQKARHVKFSFKGSATDPTADAAPDAPQQASLLDL